MMVMVITGSKVDKKGNVQEEHTLFLSSVVAGKHEREDAVSNRQVSVGDGKEKAAWERSNKPHPGSTRFLPSRGMTHLGIDF